MDSVPLTDTMSAILTLLQGAGSPVQLRKYHQTGTGQRQTLQADLLVKSLPPFSHDIIRYNFRSTELMFGSNKNVINILSLKFSVPVHVASHF